MPSASKQRGKENKFLKWRSLKKEVMLYYARGQEQQAWLKLRKLMLLTNRNLDRIQKDKKEIDVKDQYRK